MILTNPYQTQLTDELLESLHPEVKETLLDSINQIPFIKNLISPTREFAKDRPRDTEGKIIVDLLNPHILTDMDYFRQTAINFQKHGKLTNLKPDARKGSPYYNWAIEEMKRVWFGMVRPSDGEWITGEMYFYLNYMPIVQNLIDETGTIAERVVDFPQTWEGVYLWFHYLHQARRGGIYNNFEGGWHAFQIAKRGASKSYTGAAILARLFIFGDSPRAQKKQVGIAMAYDKEKLTKDGILNKFVDAVDFVAEHGQWPYLKLKDSLDRMHWKMGYKDVRKNVEGGSENEVIGVVSNDDPDKARGKRAVRLLYEEIGAFPKSMEVWNTNRRGLKSGRAQFGQAIAFGTGGSKGSNFYGALEMIYGPKGYEIYGLPNYYDKNASNQLTVFFFGAYLNRENFYNKDGVSDVTGALIEIIQKRVTTKYNSTDPATLDSIIAEDPITIQDAILSKETSLYPQSDLNERLLQIRNEPSFLDHVATGRLILQEATKNVEYKPDISVNPIRFYPHKDNKLEGAIEIHKMPERDQQGKVYSNRYIAGIDTYDDDVADTMSLGSIYILDLWTDKIVFEYTGRPAYANDFFELCRRALIFYNALGNYENNKKGLFAYFSARNSLYLLSPVLEYLRDKDMIKGQLYGNKAYGTGATTPVKSYARMLIRDWLLKPILREEVSPEGDITSVTYQNLYDIESPALLEELIQWNSKQNFDRHDALGMVMLLREDYLRIAGDNGVASMSSDSTSVSGWENDSFFDMNYDGGDAYQQLLREKFEEPMSGRIPVYQTLLPWEQ